MNYSPLDDVKLGNNDKKVDDFQIFKAKMNNRQGISSLSKPSQYNERETFFDENMRNNTDKNMINEIEKLNNETNIRNELKELERKKEFFDIDQSDKMFSSVDQYFTNSLENNKKEKLQSIFTDNIGYSMDNPENRKSPENAVSGSKFSRFFSSSNDNIVEVGTNEVPPPPHISNFDVQTIQNPMQNPMQNPIQNLMQNPMQNPMQSPIQNPIQNSMQNLMVSNSILENSASLLNKSNTISSPMEQTIPSTNMPPLLPGNFTNIPENDVNLSNNGSVSNLHKDEDTSIIDSFISKYSIPPEKIVNSTNPPPLPLQQLPINLQQQMQSPNMLSNMNQPNELPVNLANALQQPSLPQNMPPVNFNNQLPFNQLSLNLGNSAQQQNPIPIEKKIYSEEDILKSMGIKKSENENHEKTEKDIEQDKESMNRVMDLLAKSMVKKNFFYQNL